MTCVSWKKNHDKKNKICQEFEWLDIFFSSAISSVSLRLSCFGAAERRQGRFIVVLTKRRLQGKTSFSNEH